MIEYTLKAFCDACRCNREDIANYEILAPYGLRVKMKDGSVLMYDITRNEIRDLPKDPSTMTEKECRIEFGYRLRKLMRMKDIGQTELSEMTGVSQPMISNYISGQKMPTLITARRLADALGCSIDEFIYR